MKCKRFTAVFLCSVILLLLLPCMAVFSIASDDGAPAVQTGSINIQYEMPGIKFRIYQISEWKKDGSAVLTPTFADAEKYNIDLDALFDAVSNKNDIAKALSDKIDYYDETPMQEKRTDEESRVSFEDLSRGTYLVLCKPHTDAGYRYEVSPFLVTVPVLVDGNASYETPYITPKSSFTEEPYEPTYISVRVHKAWDDEGAEALRPLSVTVQLLCNGSAWGEPVVLNAEGGWSYQWDFLDASFVWSVIELDVPADYTVSVTQYGITFLITNTRTTPPEEPDPPETTEPIETTDTEPLETEPPETEPTPPETEPEPPVTEPEPPATEPEPVDTEPEPPVTEPPEDEPLLPQTGLPWNTAILLLIFGTVLLAAGLILGRREA